MYSVLHFSYFKQILDYRKTVTSESFYMSLKQLPLMLPLCTITVPGIRNRELVSLLAIQEAK